MLFVDFILLNFLVLADLDARFRYEHNWDTNKCNYQYYCLNYVLGWVASLTPHVTVAIWLRRLYEFIITVLPKSSPIFIIVEIMLGAHCWGGTWSTLSSHNFSHLKIIKKSIYPNNPTKKINWGINSKKKSTFFLKNKEFDALIHTPRVIWTIAMITEIFILRLFTNTN